MNYDSLICSKRPHGTRLCKSPRTGRSGEDLLDAHAADSFAKVRPIDFIPISEQVTRGRAGLHVHKEPIEGRFTVLLVNARHLNQVPGHESDVRDCQRIAQLLQHGLLKGSFIPPRGQRELRDLTRQRTQLVEERPAP